MPTSRDQGPTGGVRVPAEAVCLGCGYSLRGLPRAICPECGRPFDPDDPESYRDTLFPSRYLFWRRWANPPPLYHCVLMPIATFVLLDQLSVPGGTGESIVGPLAAVVMAGIYLSHFVRAYACKYYGNGSRHGESTARAKTQSRWIVSPLCLLIFALACVIGPFQVRFTLSRPSLAWAERNVRAAGVPDAREQWIGLLPVHRVAVMADGAVKFELADRTGHFARRYSLLHDSPDGRRSRSNPSGIARGWYLVEW